MKERLNEVSMANWYKCIDDLRKSNLTRKDIGFLDILHMKRSGHEAMLQVGLKLINPFTLKIWSYWTN